MTLRRLFPLLLVLLAACGDEGPGGGDQLGMQLCGNGRLEAGEVCDDGNVTTEVCAYGEGPCKVCDATCNLVDGETSACGDGRIDSSRETCDDGNTVTETCGYGERCPSVCDASCKILQLQRRFCGDGVVDGDGGELCDDGPDNDDGVPGACRRDCTPARCGDGVIDPGETCEQPGKGTCRDDCSTGTCGDGVVDPWEACEPSIDAACRADCTLPYCGDGRIDADETCDDGTFVPLATAGSASGTCAIVEGGVVRCWSGNPELDAVPTELPAASQLTVGRSWACALDVQGRPRCWGEDPLGAANGLLTPPGERFAGIAAGLAHTCGVTDAGELRCWGRLSEEPPEGAGFAQVASGHGFSCALHDDGAVKCWGTSTFGETLPPPGTFTAIAAGPTHACALDSNRYAKCWGSLPVGPPSEPLQALASAGSVVCGLSDERSALCWGEGATVHVGPFERLAVLDEQVCGVDAEGVYCWGARVAMRVNADGLPGACRTDCTAFTCGDGVVDPGEACDDGNTIDDGNGCAADCTMNAVCGDGLVQAATEDCDEGDTALESCDYGTSCVVCDPSCKWGAGAQTFCGDGVLGGDEACDDGIGLPFVQLALGLDYGCGVTEDGSLHCWDHDQLADVPEGTFVQVGISAGAANTAVACALHVDGRIECWGELAYAVSLPPPPEQGPFVDLAMASRHACAIHADGRLQCWGDTRPGEDPPAGGPWTRVAVDAWRACAIDANGAITCWDSDGVVANVPQGTFVDVAIGGTRNCAIGTDGMLVCWGEEIPGGVPEFRVVDISVGNEHVCVLDAAEQITCVGEQRQTPEPDTARYRSIASGTHWACGVGVDGATRCWGQGGDPPPANGDTSHRCRTSCVLPACGDGIVDFGNETCDDGNADIEVCASYDRTCLVCGLGCLADEGIPRTCGDGVVDPEEVCDDGHPYLASLDMGAGFSCALADQIPRCWGRNDHGQASPPRERMLRLAVGERHTCAIRKVDGSIVCWGADDLGQLAAPPQGDFSSARIVAGRDFTCVLNSPGAFTCWGDVPFVPPTTGVFLWVTAGERHVCALDAQRTVHCWGENDLGQAAPPAALAGAVGPVPGDFLVAGRNHTCALVDVVPVCWGDDAAGQSSPPAGLQLDGLLAGEGITCGRSLATGTWTCWGTGGVAPPVDWVGQTAISRWESSFTCAYGNYDGACVGSPVEPSSVPRNNHNSRPDACRIGCLPARCGDGVIDTGETCDDRNSVSGDGCSAACTAE